LAIHKQRSKSEIKKTLSVNLGLTYHYLSFKEKKTLSLEATSITEFPDNIISIGDYRILKSVVIYGANSSGKSNLIKGLTFMQEFVSNSAKKSSTDEIDTTPFLLNITTENEPSYFEVLFLIENIRYRYGFEVTRKRIFSEWLYKCEGKKEEYLFIRDNDIIDIADGFDEANKLADKTRENALFLSVIDQFNGKTAKKVMEWFGSHSTLSGIQHEKGRSRLLSMLDFQLLEKDLRQFIAKFNLGFTEFEQEEKSEDIKFNRQIFTTHNKYDDLGNIVGNIKFSLSNNESSGTNKLFDLAYDILIGLFLGRLSVIDELDAKLHPLLTLAIVNMFNSNDDNYFNAQLIFATHDTNLLSFAKLRRDQIYFTEKNQTEETDLYSLVEYREEGKKVRNDRSYEKDYIQGRYGAIPFIGNINSLN